MSYSSDINTTSLAIASTRANVARASTCLPCICMQSVSQRTREECTFRLFAERHGQPHHEAIAHPFALDGRDGAHEARIVDGQELQDRQKQQQAVVEGVALVMLHERTVIASNPRSQISAWMRVRSASSRSSVLNDRDALEAKACNCHRAIKSRYADYLQSDN